MASGGLPAGPGPDALGEGIPGGLPRVPAQLRTRVAEVPLGEGPPELAGRSPGRLAWTRLRGDRVALGSAGVLVFFLLVAAAAPLISRWYGVEPSATFPAALDNYGFPLGYLGGVNGDHWFGVQPKTSHDIFVLVVHGLRTSLAIALVSAVITIAVGILAGVVAGYVGGRIDAAMSWVIDLTLAFPFFVFCLAAIPLLTYRIYTVRQEVPPWFRGLLLVVIFTVFNWTYTARLVRGQVLSLREREFVQAARAAGAGTGHILFRQLLPNLWGPILVTFSLDVPAFITAEAALSFIGVGMVEPTPDLGRLIFDSTGFVRSDPTYTLIPGAVIFLLVLAFNLFGDALRDALDPKSAR
jgi:peptide/nickel transport system permease protein